ncbi:hypothetical protein BT96DRAFT_294725 [Gymnopus androsaceus JB14]|uniref:Uncharacterized protein n=1 Tax=Gymnopus androsaceus JB14 TaxID=1447944 RepID=A0A6A4I5J8_9AGAR|nr:hypothetical protein BT96DRAFT_294725 [Gymnopus androsaceus JB14]
MSLRHNGRDLDSLVRGLTGFQQRSSTSLSSLALHRCGNGNGALESEILIEKAAMSSQTSKTLYWLVIGGNVGTISVFLVSNL